MTEADDTLSRLFRDPIAADRDEAFAARVADRLPSLPVDADPGRRGSQYRPVGGLLVVAWLSRQLRVCSGGRRDHRDRGRHGSRLRGGQRPNGGPLAPRRAWAPLLSSPNAQRAPPLASGRGSPGRYHPQLGAVTKRV